MINKFLSSLNYNNFNNDNYSFYLRYLFFFASLIGYFFLKLAFIFCFFQDISEALNSFFILSLLIYPASSFFYLFFFRFFHPSLPDNESREASDSYEKILWADWCGFWVTFFMFSTLFTAFFIFWDVLYCGEEYLLDLGSWITVGVLDIHWSFLIDSVTAVMLVVVLSISCLVHLYSFEYMFFDPARIRFISFLSLFTFFMLFLVTSGNFVQLFLGWEGVGLSSYLLINFWYTRLEANRSALKAIIVNRFGDVGIYLALLSIIFLVKTVDFLSAFSLAHLLVEIYLPGTSILFLDFLNLCIVIGAVGKSAQIGLHTWLPDAMEGPTPVSALIHAATMVTAGVFVLIRCSPLLEFSSNVLSLVTWIGALTTLFAASIGCFQNDIKKVIAYSTCSQLGYMFIACGLSGYSIALFHLFNHAFFKALLFLCAGSVIHALNDEQDIRKMGGLAKLLPVTYICMFIASLALAGFPFLSGFYSKDLILELALASSVNTSLLAYWAGTLTVFLTSFYSIRLLYYVFLGSCNLSYKHNISESSWITLSVLLVLSLASLFTGYFFKELFVGFGSSTFANSMLVLPIHNNLFDIEFLSIYWKLVPFFFSIFGMLLSFLVYYYFWPAFNAFISTSKKKVKHFSFVRYPMLRFRLFIVSYLYKLSKSRSSVLASFSPSLHTRLALINSALALMERRLYTIFQISGFYWTYSFFSHKWYFDAVYNRYIVMPVLSFSYNITFKLLDRGLIELFGPLGIVRLFKFFSKSVSSLQSGFIFFYIFLMVFSLFLFFFVFFLVGSSFYEFLPVLIGLFFFELLRDLGWFSRFKK